MAVALEQEMRARVVEAEAEVPRAMAEAFRRGTWHHGLLYRRTCGRTSMRVLSPVPRRPAHPRG